MPLHGLEVPRSQVSSTRLLGERPQIPLGRSLSFSVRHIADASAAAAARAAVGNPARSGLRSDRRELIPTSLDRDGGAPQRGRRGHRKSAIACGGSAEDAGRSPRCDLDHFRAFRSVVGHFDHVAGVSRARSRRKSLRAMPNTRRLITPEVSRQALLDRLLRRLCSLGA